MNLFVKKLPYSKVSKKAAQLEYELQNYISLKYNFSPKVDSLTFMSTYSEIIMQKIQGKTLADKYGHESTDIPNWVWNEMRRIVTTLYNDEGIEYIDITPYNFMIDENDKIWIIDFGHAYYTGCAESQSQTDTSKINWFLAEFIYDEVKSFNPDFA
jgi:RIO-like serine/threonine protein kinase